MPLKRKGRAPPIPNYESNEFDPSNHHASIHTQLPTGVAPEALRGHLEIERDHYMATSLVAGVHPVTKQEVPFPGAEKVETLFDRGIAAACLASEGMTFVHASIKVTRRDPTRWDPTSDIVEVSVTDSGGELPPAPPLPVPERFAGP